jgi:hypothetical protein
LPVVPEYDVVGERKFITATEIGRFGDIPVMAQIQRNVGIPVTLAGSWMPRGIAINHQGMSR